MTIRLSHLGLSAAVIVAAVTTILFTGTALAQFATEPFHGQFTEGSLSISGSINQPLFAGQPVTPGDRQTTAVTVTSNGSVDLRYAVVSTTSEDILAAELELTIWQAAGEGTCDSRPTPTVLYGPGPLGSTRGINVIGDPAQGSHTGDRTLSGSTAETLCFMVTAPLTLDNTFQGRATQPVFQFDAEQLQQNP